MQTFKKFSSKIVKLPYKDIDTDMIIPAEYLKTTSKEGLGKYAFINMKKAYADFPEFNGERIIVAGKNFGCGSSREHAPWALKDLGIDVIISSEFADIFRGNSEKNQLLLIQLNDSDVTDIVENFSELEVDLENQTVISESGKKYSFEINSFVKDKILNGLSDLDYLLNYKGNIEKFNFNKTPNPLSGA